MLYSTKTMVSFLLVLFVSIQISAEIIQYPPHESWEIYQAATGKYHKNEVCFLRSQWDTTGASTSLTVVEKAAGHWTCIDKAFESDIIRRLFDLQGFNNSEYAAVTEYLMEAILLIHNGEEALSTMSRTGILTNSYLRYFSQEDFSIVYGTLAWLSQLLGKSPRKGRMNVLDVSLYLPLTVQHQHTHPSGNQTCQYATAFMSTGMFFGNVVPEDTRSEMCICSRMINARNLASIKCDSGRTALDSLGLVLSVILTHELFHWGALAESRKSKQGIGDRIFYSPTLAYHVSAYGPWMVQELRRVEPWKATTNADSFMYFLLEEYLKSHRGRNCWFEDNQYDPDNSWSPEESSERVEDDSMFEHPGHKFSRFEPMRRSFHSCPKLLDTIKIIYDHPYHFVGMAVVLCSIIVVCLAMLVVDIVVILRILWQKISQNLSESNPDHPQSHLGFEATSEYMYLNGRLVRRNDKLLLASQKKSSTGTSSKSTRPTYAPM